MNVDPLQNARRLVAQFVELRGEVLNYEHFSDHIEMWSKLFQNDLKAVQIPPALRKPVAEFLARYGLFDQLIELCGELEYSVITRLELLEQLTFE